MKKALIYLFIYFSLLFAFFFFFFKFLHAFFPNTTHREIDVLSNPAGKCCFCHSGSLSRRSPSGQNTAKSLILEGWSRRTDCVTRHCDGGIKMQRGDIFRAVMWRGPLTLAAMFPACGRNGGGGLYPDSPCHPFLISTAGPEAGSGAYPNFAHVHRSEQDSGTLSLQFPPDSLEWCQSLAASSDAGRKACKRSLTTAVQDVLHFFWRRRGRRRREGGGGRREMCQTVRQTRVFHTMARVFDSPLYDMHGGHSLI